MISIAHTGTKLERLGAFLGSEIPVTDWVLVNASEDVTGLKAAYNDV